MSSDDLETLLLQNPDKPHRFVLSSGDQVIVPNALSAVFQGLHVEITNFVAPGRRLALNKTRVSVPNVVLAELYDDAADRGRRTRRRR